MIETAVELECLTFGAGHAGEGVCLLVRMGPHRILLDCGLVDVAPLVSSLEEIRYASGRPEMPVDFIWCSHAHADHARGLLRLHQAFPQVPIYASDVTAQLLPLNWLEQDLSGTPPFCQALPWRVPMEFQAGLSAELWPAGHLPGAAALLLTYLPQSSGPTPTRPYTLFYTGDFFLSNSRLVEGLPLEELRGLKPDVLIVEGSYGTARHPRRRQQELQLAERIRQAMTPRGELPRTGTQQSVLLPTATLGLGQELLMLLRSHHHFTGRDLDIWVDGTVATACDAYLELLPHLPSSVQNFAGHQSLFWDERVRPRVRRVQTAEHRRTLGESPCVVVTDLSMDLSVYCQTNPESWLVLLPEFQREPSPDERLRLPEGLTNVETYLLAAHSDGAGTAQLIHNLRPQHVVFVHSSPLYLSDLTNLEELHNRYQLHSPAPGSFLELPIGETFVQPTLPDSNYEGELLERGGMVSIRLPDTIATDPRWQAFADTGLVEARWQGQELVLRGLPQWELLNQEHDFTQPDASRGTSLRDCCGTCVHYRGQHCWNQTSSLFSFKVTPEGYCPVFEPKHRGEPQGEEPQADLQEPSDE